MSIIQKVAMNHIAGLNDGLVELRDALGAVNGRNDIYDVSDILVKYRMDPMMLDYALDHLRREFSPLEIFEGFYKLNLYHFQRNILKNSRLVKVFKHFGLKSYFARAINNMVHVYAEGEGDILLGQFTHTPFGRHLMNNAPGGETVLDKVVGAILDFNAYDGVVDFRLGLQNYDEDSRQYFSGLAIEYTGLTNPVYLSGPSQDVESFYENGAKNFDAYLKTLESVQFRERMR